MITHEPPQRPTGNPFSFASSVYFLKAIDLEIWYDTEYFFI